MELREHDELTDLPTTEAAAPAGASYPHRASGLQRARRLQAWWLVLPTAVVLAAVAGWPLARTIFFSLTDANLSALSARRFVGLANYLGGAGHTGGVLFDPGWWEAVGNTLLFTASSVGLETVLGLGVALLLNHPSRMRTVLRAAVLVPWAIPTVVSAKMWTWMLHDQFGVINTALVAMGLVSEPLAWTADASLSFLTIVMVDVWKTTPFMALLTLAALQMVPRDCYEAAEVDGVPAWRVFTHVTLPFITPALLVAVVFRGLDALRVFDVIYVMTSNSRATRSMSVYVREQLIDFQHIGYGSAAATLLFVTIALITVATLRLARSRLQGAD